jgi:hypothetical protein
VYLKIFVLLYVSKPSGISSPIMKRKNNEDKHKRKSFHLICARSDERIRNKIAAKYQSFSSFIHKIAISAKNEQNYSFFLK